MLERVWNKANLLILLVRMQTSTTTMENSVEKLDIELLYDPAMAHPLRKPELKETLYPSVHRSTVYNS